MNKKFLSAILFGALMVTSTGTFVSCKDYDDDIDELWEQINAQKSDLSTQVSTLQSALNSANSDIAAAKSEAAAAASKADKAGEEAALAKQAAAEAKAAAIEEAIKQAKELIAAVEAKAVSKEDYDAKVKEIEGKVTSLETQLAAVEKYKELIEKKADKSTVDALNAAIADLQAAIGKTATSAGMEELAAKIAAIQAELVTLKTTQLRSLVYVPSLYLDGVEADRYAYADGLYLKANALTSDLSGYGDNVNFVIKKGAKNDYSEDTKAQFYLSSIDSVYYHLNPTHADLKDVVWSFNGTDAEFVSRAANWAPQFVGKAVNDGVLSVAYSIKNPNKLISTKEDSLSIMSLNAELANDSTVNSDYSAILPAVRVLKAIGLTDKNLAAVDCANTKLADELYATAKIAAEKAATIPVQYNKGAVNLDNYFNVHYIQNDFTKPVNGEHQAMTYTEALNNWGLKLTYELIPYTVGENKTSEDAYGQIDGNKFYPCYVDSEGKSYKCDANGGTTGISAVGKKPIVLVTLVDTNNKNAVVLSGYVKLLIQKEVKNDAVVIKPAFEVPYVCEPEAVSITWAQASDQIYEATTLSKDEFVKNYIPTSITINGVKAAYIKDGDEFKATTDYGYVVEPYEQNQGSTNEVVTWQGTRKNLDNINKAGGEMTVYIKYNSRTDISNYYYIGVTIKVLPKPEVTLGEKIEKYWFPTTKTVAERDSVRASVPVPDDNNNVTNYVKDMDDYFMGNAVKPFATSATQNSAYFDKKTGFTQQFNYNYQFAVAQPKVGDYQLYLKVTTYKDKVPTAWDVENLYADNTTTAKVTEEDLIATINTTTGEVTYNSGDVAKTVLNLFGHNDPKSAAANIEIVSTYGTCEIPLTNDDFTVRFQRPVDIVKGATAKFEDAQANGSSVVLGDLLGLKDWREVALVVYDTTNKKYVSNKENGCLLYDYYDFKNLKIDIDNAQCDLNGKKQKVSEVTNKLQLTVDGNNPVDISNVDALNTTKITYKNNEGNVQNFNLWIPVEITYSWGTLKGEIEAVVKSTKASSN